MKHIQKRSTPAILSQWLEGQPVENGKRLNCGYKEMPSEVRQAIREYLLTEQGWLCCYTGIRISIDKSHIEHFKPQALCVDHEDVDYNNLLLAYPSEQRERQYGRCQFGAQAKANWYDEQLLVSPLRGDCESRFKFNQFGEIRAAQRTDRAAQTTIQRLGLNNASLTEMRRQAIESVLFRKPNQHLSQKQLKKIVQSYCQLSEDNRFRAFCFVISQAAHQLLRQVERKRKRKQYSRQSKNK
jgi:uncharacterized protein (TIGR02646 family)